MKHGSSNCLSRLVHDDDDDADDDDGDGDDDDGDDDNDGSNFSRNLASEM